MPQGVNRRFVVPNPDGDPEQVYDIFVRRGDAGNHIKDLKNALFADRLSCSSFTANAFRLVLHAAASLLMHALRGHLAGTDPAMAQFDTLRLRLLKVGATVTQSVRRVRVRAASEYTYRDPWILLHKPLAEPAPS